MESDEENKAHTSQNPKMQDLDKQNQIDDEKGLVLIPNYDIHIGGKSVYVHDNFVFPIGYRFCPHDEELIVHYLKKKIMNELLPHDRIKEVNLYKHSPQELAENYSVLGENEWYFFTPRDRKYPNGHRPNRAAGTGYWKATGADKPIKHNNVEVGFRKALVFYEGKPPKGDQTNWIMHEFTVNKSRRLKTHSADMKLDDWVLCRIYKRVDNSKVTRKEEEHHQEDATKGISLIPNMSEDKLENCNYEGPIDSCEEFAKQQFAPPFDPNFLDFSNYNPDYFPHYGARSSNYGMNLQSSVSPPGNMFSTRSSNYGMNLQSSVSLPGNMFSDYKGSYQEGNIFPMNFEFNNFEDSSDNIGEDEFHNVFDIGVLDENLSIDKV